MVKQKLLTFLPAFEIEIGNVGYGRVQKLFSLFKPTYEIDYNGWRMEGDFIGWDYDVYKEIGTVMHISKEPLH